MNCYKQEQIFDLNLFFLETLQNCLVDGLAEEDLPEFGVWLGLSKDIFCFVFAKKKVDFVEIKWLTEKKVAGSFNLKLLA
jgi:hypothetical protein